MVIAVMLRAMDQDSGFRAYIEGLIDSMLALDGGNTYLLFYRTPKWFGRFSSRKNAREFLLSAPHKFAWDQVAVPYRAWKEGADVIFNPKFSVPLISPCPVAMGLQEPDWWVSPGYYERFDAFFTKRMLPVYCRKASWFFPMSRFNLEESRKYIGLPLKNASVTYTCPGKHMKPIVDPGGLQAFRETYRLPDRFILVVTRVDHPGLDRFEKIKGFYPGKNPETVLRAFLLCRDDIPHHLVFAGRRVREYMTHSGFADDDFERVHFIPFVPYEELHKLYNAADMSVMPARYDGCSTTMMESMACGCPVVASNTGASMEIGGDGALYADPDDPAGFAERIRAVGNDAGLRGLLRGKCLERSAVFSWEKTARTTLEGLMRAARAKRGSGGAEAGR